MGLVPNCEYAVEYHARQKKVVSFLCLYIGLWMLSWYHFGGLEVLFGILHRPNVFVSPPEYEVDYAEQNDSPIN
jgi:hypothetical protein